MAVLGYGGRVELKRDAPPACLIEDDALDFRSNQLEDICDGYMNGDRVVVVGLPVMDGLFPTKPDGYATYQGSKWYIGPNRWHIEDNDDDFYKASSGFKEDYPSGAFGDNAKMYVKEGDRACIDQDNTKCDDIPGVETDDYYIHINNLGYVSFYKDRCEALVGCAQWRVDLINVGGPIIVGPYGNTDYNNALTTCYEGVGLYENSDVLDSVELSSICEDAPVYRRPEAGTAEYDNADIQPRREVSPDALWLVICELRNWSLEISAPAVDTTGVGEKWGNSIKSIVSGGGTMEYFIDRNCLADCQMEPLDLMQLVTLTEEGCRAKARFTMVRKNLDDPCNELCLIDFPGHVYYEMDVLMTGNAVNVRPSEMVVGSASFVTTDEIKLLMSPT